MKVKETKTRIRVGEGEVIYKTFFVWNATFQSITGNEKKNCRFPSFTSEN
jgi:hypothetical protein